MTTTPDFLFHLAKPQGLLEFYYYSMTQKFFFRQHVDQDKEEVLSTEVLTDEQVSLLVCQLAVAKKEPELLSINSVLRKIKLYYFLGA